MLILTSMKISKATNQEINRVVRTYGGTTQIDNNHLLTFTTQIDRLPELSEAGTAIIELFIPGTNGDSHISHELQKAIAQKFKLISLGYECTNSYWGYWKSTNIVTEPILALQYSLKRFRPYHLEKFKQMAEVLKYQLNQEGVSLVLHLSTGDYLLII